MLILLWRLQFGEIRVKGIETLQTMPPTHGSSKAMTVVNEFIRIARIQ
jgi:hypothetical protein